VNIISFIDYYSSYNKFEHVLKYKLIKSLLVLFNDYDDYDFYINADYFSWRLMSILRFSILNDFLTSIASFFS